MAKKQVEKQIIFTSKMVDEITTKINDGILIKRFQNPWLKGEVGIKRSGLAFRMTDEEQEEYVKCALDVNYFVEKYCKVKREDGTIGHITLRDYQEDILNNFSRNRFNILVSSRQVGKCVNYNTIIAIEKENVKYDVRIGKLYYSMLSKERKLTIFEKIKMRLYDWIYYLDKK